MRTYLDFMRHVRDHGTRKEDREVTDAFAAGAAGLLLAGGALSALWFRRLP